MASALRLSVSVPLIAAQPAFVDRQNASLASAGGDVAKRSDRLVRHLLIASDKEEFTAPIARQAGTREIVRVQPLVRLVTSLSSGDEFAADIPAFDPAHQLAEEPESDPAASEPETELSNTAVTITRADLDPASVDDNAPSMSDDNVTALVEAEESLTRITSLPGGASLVPQRLLSMALESAGAEPSLSPGDVDESNPFKAIEVRVVPENVTSLPKTAPASRAGVLETRDIVLEPGQTLAEALAQNGADPSRIQGILAALSEHFRSALSEGQHLNLLIMRHGSGPTSGQIARVTFYGVDGVEEIAAERDAGGFVSVVPAASLQAAEANDTAEATETGSLYNGIYEAVLRNGLPRELAERIVNTFAFGMDMRRVVKPSDRLEVLYSPADGKSSTPADMLYVCLILDGVKHRAYRFEAPDTGAVSYFSEDGSSLRRFLLRMPIAEGRVTSPFGTRMHPILHYARFHNGIDWANRAGTPIMATGNGTVVFAGPRGGYGNRIEIRHANGYATAYNHLQRFSHTVRANAPVRQGQVIAYMGSTGLSTGPHVHYEVSVNGRFLDPMSIRLPDSHGVPEAAMPMFKRQVLATNAIRHHDTLALSAEPL